MRTLRPEEFATLYGEESLMEFPKFLPQEPSFLQRVKQTAQSGLQLGQESLGTYLESPDKTLGGGIRAGAGLFAGATRAAAAPIMEIPGFKQIGEAFGKSGEFIESTALGGLPSDALSNLPEGVLDTTANVAEGAMNVAALQGTAQQVRALPGQVRALVDKTRNAIPPDGVGGALQTVVEKTGNTSPAIMNRVARLKPTDANKFKQLSGGKTHGDYLSETGNFGAPDKIVANEAQKFAQSRLDVDNALAQLPGEYKVGALKDSLGELVRKAKAESSKGVKSPYLDRVMELARKYNKQGLNMSEINEVKRLYESKVKLGYRGVGAQMNPEAVNKATNVDSALRKWQMEKASELGFKNIKEMNKQTQLSKFITDKLGAQITGKTGLNEVSLTDWIMLSGGDPAAIGGFLTKRFLSSNSVQARIAQMLKQGETTLPVKPQISGGRTKPQSQPLSQKVSKDSSSNDATGNGQSARMSNVNNKAPTNNTSSRTISESVPQKKGLIQRVVDRYKNTPNKKGGFINVGEPLSTSGSRFEPQVQKIVGKMADQNHGLARNWPDKAAKTIRGEFRDRAMNLKQTTLSEKRRSSLYQGFFDKKLSSLVSQNHGSLREMFAKAADSKIEIDKFAGDLANKTGNRLATTPLKSESSVIRKLGEPDTNGNHNNINDLARNTIVLDNPSSYKTIISTLEKRGNTKVKVQKPESYMGYEGTIVNFKTSNGLISEIQVTSPKMVWGKMTPEVSKKILGIEEWTRIGKETGLQPGRGHVIYEKFREMNKSQREGSEGKKLLRESFDYYNKLR